MYLIVIPVKVGIKSAACVPPLSKATHSKFKANNVVTVLSLFGAAAAEVIEAPVLVPTVQCVPLHTIGESYQLV